MIKEEIVKPSFDLEVKAEIKGISKLENNIKDIKKFAIDLQDYYNKVEFVKEGTIIDDKNIKEINDKKKEAGIEKAEVNKFKNKINDLKKQITLEFNKPLDVFTSEAKETIQILTDTYDLINKQVSLVDNQIKENKESTIKKYFNEYKESNHIDFINYEQANINITLNNSLKSLKKEVTDFIDKVVNDLELINEEEYKVEILVDYKKSLNVADSILGVKRRNTAIREVKEKLEKEKQIIQEEEKVIEKVEKVIKTPIVENVCLDETKETIYDSVIIKMKNVSKTQIIKVKNLLKEEGIIYE